MTHLAEIFQNHITFPKRGFTKTIDFLLDQQTDVVGNSDVGVFHLPS